LFVLMLISGFFAQSCLIVTQLCIMKIFSKKRYSSFPPRPFFYKTNTSAISSAEEARRESFFKPATLFNKQSVNTIGDTSTIESDRNEDTATFDKVIPRPVIPGPVDKSIEDNCAIKNARFTDLPGSNLFCSVTGKDDKKTVYGTAFKIKSEFESNGPACNCKYGE